MSFVDKVVVKVIAGDGGDGKISFRHEKFVDRGGPDGGDGGDGGDVILQASRNQDTLAAFRFQKEIKAGSGNPGDKTRKHGRSAKDLIVAVPVGTYVTTESGETLADLVEDGQQATIAFGGKGGFGNAHFVSSRRQAPKFAEKGEPGDQLTAVMELKLIADVGLVGMPNAGKSTFLATTSNARPEIADYPFTTLTPNLGVVDIDKQTTVLVADIPGLIEGAAEGKGLGHDFLRHIERTAVILHLIDAYNDDVAITYQTVRQELKEYDKELAKRSEVVALTKIEGLDSEITEDLMHQLRRVVPAKTPIHAISSKSGQGVSDLLFAIKKMVLTSRKKIQPQKIVDEIPVLRLADTTNQWQVTKEGEKFRISGPRIETFAVRTDFTNPEAVLRLRHIMRKMGIEHELLRQGIKDSGVVVIGDKKLTYN